MAGAGGGGAPIRVLVVDDHRMFAEALVEALALEPDITVVGLATTADDALDVQARAQPKVVLMDYQLGASTGAAATRRLHAADPEVRVLMVTSHAESDVLAEALDANCAGFLGKHEPIREVINAIRLAAAGGMVIPPSLLSRLLASPQPGPGPPPRDLTPRDREVLALLAAGRSNREIADELCMSIKTIRNYVQRVIMKMGAHSKLEAVANAAREGLVQLGR